MREHHLDGLRGWAALIVVFCHLRNALWADWAPGFEVLLVDGSLAVFVFFVLSGYVLSVEFFRTGERRVVLDLALRRYPRLTIPILGVSAAAAVLMSLGLMHNISAGAASGSVSWLSTFYQFTPTLSGLLEFALLKVYIATPSSLSYNSSLWTMPTEMQGSMLLFALLLVIGKSKIARWCGLVLVVVATALMGSAMLGIFAGAVVAAFTQSAASRRLQSSRVAPYLVWVLLLGGFGLAAVRPANFSPVWLTACSVSLVWAVLLSDRLQRVLSAPVSQWLGRISFPLYLVHILVICSFTSWAYLSLGAGRHLSGIESTFLSVMSLGACLVAARVAQPLEHFAIRTGRSLSRFVLQRGADVRAGVRRSA